MNRLMSEWGPIEPPKTNLTGDLERAYNYGWKSAIEYMQSNKESVSASMEQKQLAPNEPCICHQTQYDPRLVDMYNPACPRHNPTQNSSLHYPPAKEECDIAVSECSIRWTIGIAHCFKCNTSYESEHNCTKT